MVRLFDLLNHSEDSGEDSKSPSVLSRDSGLSSSEATSTSTPPSMELNINLKRKLTDKGATSALSDIKPEGTGNVANATPYSKERPKINPLPRQHPKLDDKGIVNPSSGRIYKLVPKTKIHRKFLDAKKFVQIAIRRKSSSKNSHNYNNEGEEEDQFNENNSTSKLHIKSLEAGLRVKLTFAPSLFSLYKSLTPNTNRKANASVMNYDPYTMQSYAKVINEDEEALDAYNRHINDTNNAKDEVVNKSGFKSKNNTLVSKSVQLIDSNLVDLTKTSNKVLKTFNLNQDISNNDSHPASPKSKSNSFYHSPDPVPSQKKRKPNEASKKRDISPTFNSLSTAVQSLFGITDYTLIRVTRSTTNDSEGSVLLKLETAKPGDYKLFDDNEYISEMAHSIGQKGSVPSNLFIKKIVARPRYKSDMKIYIIPKLDDISFYLDSRMFERDLFYGVIDFDIPLSKKIYCNFEINEMVENFRELLKFSEVEHQAEKSRKVIIEHQDEETDSEVNDEGISDSSSSQHELRSHPQSLKLNSASTGYFAPSPKAFSDSPTSDVNQFSLDTNPEQPPNRLLHTMSEISAYPNFFSSDKLTPRPGSSSDNSSIVSRSGIPPVTKQTNSLPYVMPSPSSSSIPSLTSSSSASTASSNSLATQHSSASLSNPSSKSIISLPSHPLSSPKINGNQGHISLTTLPPPSSIFNYLKEKKGY